MAGWRVAVDGARSLQVPPGGWRAALAPSVYFPSHGETSVLAERCLRRREPATGERSF